MCLPEPVDAVGRLPDGQARRRVTVVESLRQHVLRDAAVSADRNPDPRQRLVTGHEQRSAPVAERPGGRGGEAVETGQPVAAVNRIGDPGDDAEMVLVKPIAQRRLGRHDVDGLGAEHGPDPCGPDRGPGQRPAVRSSW